jgi:hypothetical protein
MFLNKKISKKSVIGISDKSYDVFNDEIIWNANYDGKIANLSVDTNRNGIKKHIDMKLTNNDLSRLLSVPSINKSLDKRLLNVLNNHNSEPNVYVNNLEKNPFIPMINKIKTQRHISTKNKLNKIKSKYFKTKKNKKYYSNK